MPITVDYRTDFLPLTALASALSARGATRLALAEHRARRAEREREAAERAAMRLAESTRLSAIEFARQRARERMEAMRLGARLAERRYQAELERRRAIDRQVAELWEPYYTPDQLQRINEAQQALKTLEQRGSELFDLSNPQERAAYETQLRALSGELQNLMRSPSYRPRQRPNVPINKPYTLPDFPGLVFITEPNRSGTGYHTSVVHSYRPAEQQDTSPLPAGLTLPNLVGQAQAAVRARKQNQPEYRLTPVEAIPVEPQELYEEVRKIVRAHELALQAAQDSRYSPPAGPQPLPIATRYSFLRQPDARRLALDLDQMRTTAELKAQTAPAEAQPRPLPQSEDQLIDGAIYLVPWPGEERPVRAVWDAAKRRFHRVEGEQ